MTKIFFIGAPYWCQYLSRVLKTDGGIEFLPVNLKSADAVLSLFRHSGHTIVAVGLGGRVSLKRLVIWTLILLFLLRGVGRNRAIFYWIGTDVCSLNGNPFSPIYVWICHRAGIQHICGAPWFVGELEQHGIHATPVLFPYDTSVAAQFIAPRLEDFPIRICTYLTSSAWENLQGARIMQLATLLPEVQWTVIGMLESELPKGVKPLSNVAFLGWVENPVEVQAESHAFIRLVQHDALSGVVRDAIALRRIVFYSLPVSGAIYVDGSNKEIAATIIAAFAAHPRKSTDESQRQHFSLPPYSKQLDRLRTILKLEAKC